MISLPTLKTKDIARMFNIDIETVRRMVQRGELRAYKIGKGYRFFPSDIEQYIQNKKVEKKSKDVEFIE